MATISRRAVVTGALFAPAALRAENSVTAERRAALAAHAAARNLTALLVTENGETVFTAGNPAAKVNVRSVRKSVLSALAGMAVDDGRLSLNATLGELGIDDRAPRLTEGEKRATVRDLLTARSGVYHAAAYETARMRGERPARGSHPPGTFWWYNNWDFNALGTIVGRAFGQDLFAAVEARIARPLGMQDFRAADGTAHREPPSDHAAYPMRFTARDLERFGALYRDGGRWNGRPLLSPEWVRQSTAGATSTEGYGPFDYGYLWWVARPALFGGERAFLASGTGGQYVLVIPARRRVVVQLVTGGRSGGGSTAAFLRAVGAFG